MTPMPTPMRLSVVMPVLNEVAEIDAVLTSLAPLRSDGHQLIVVDGGSHDGTMARCTGRADALLHAPRGRATQMNAGAARAHGKVLLFLHADTRLPDDAAAAIGQAIAAGAEWGRFNVAIRGHSMMFPVIATLMNLRSRYTGIATGDQAIFVGRELFERIGGYAELPLMEDIDLCKRLRARAAPACLRQRVWTSGRRWERHGVWRTIILMWRLRWLYWRGEPASALARAYR